MSNMNLCKRLYYLLLVKFERFDNFMKVFDIIFGGCDDNVVEF